MWILIKFLVGGITPANAQGLLLVVQGITEDSIFHPGIEPGLVLPIVLSLQPLQMCLWKLPH